jgi:YVTN family beta-propeller protein
MGPATSARERSVPPSLGAALLAITLTALAGCASGSAEHPAGVSAGAPAAAGSTAGVAAAAPSLLYVCNQNDATVSVIDTRSRQVVRVIDLQQLGFSANAKPHHVAIEPDGSFWYVTLIGDGRIVKLDRNDRVVAQVPFETPGMLALHPTEDLLYVGRSMTAVNPPRRIGVIRRSDMELEEVEVLFPRPHAMAIEPRSGVVYTASLAVNQMAVYDPASEQVSVLDVDGPPHALMQFAVSPDGSLLAVSGELSGQVIFFDIREPRTPRRVASIAVGAQPFDPVFTRDGRWLYLGNKAENTVTVIDAGSRTIAAVVRGEGLAQPHGTAVSRDGTMVFVSNNNTGQAHAMGADGKHAAGPVSAAGRGTVVVIDTRSRTIARVIEVGHNASGIAVPTSP